MHVRKALLTAAGFGTRFLPITKTIQKEMLPILERPLIDYTVSDCVAAGIEEIIFVISEHNQQLLHFYRENLRLKKYLESMNKIELYGRVDHLHEQVKMTFIRQPDDRMYGTAVPLQLAEKQLHDEAAFFVFLGDDCMYSPDGSSEAVRMLSAFHQAHVCGLATCIEVPRKEVSRYGVCAPKIGPNGEQLLAHMVEKPTVEAAPSNLINISKYILPPDVFEILRTQAPDSQSGELYITDTVTTLAQSKPVLMYQPQGTYLDGGNPLNWLKANLTVAWNNPEYRTALKQLVQHLDQNKLTTA